MSLSVSIFHQAILHHPRTPSREACRLIVGRVLPLLYIPEKVPRIFPVRRSLLALGGRKQTFFRDQLFPHPETSRFAPLILAHRGSARPWLVDDRTALRLQLWLENITRTNILDSSFKSQALRISSTDGNSSNICSLQKASVRISAVKQFRLIGVTRTNEASNLKLLLVDCRLLYWHLVERPLAISAVKYCRNSFG